LILLLLSWSALSHIGCRNGASGAKTSYDSAWQQTKSGDLTAALKTVDQGLVLFPDPHSDWHWRFLTLKAEILMRQGLYEDSLSLLNVELPRGLAQSDSAVWQKLTQGISLAYLGRYPQAEAVLSQAQSLASSVAPQLMGEVLLRQGTTASLQWDLEKAKALFRSTLEFSQAHNDPFLEGSALGSLGLVAARRERYDESLDWNKQALQLDQSHGWSGLTAKAEGNIGWSYYLVGDLVSALALDNQADVHDVEAGVPERRITWLINAGTVYYDLHDYVSAEAKSHEALALAESLKDNGDIIYCLQNLALVSLARNQFDAAKESVKEALRLEKLAPDHARELYTHLIGAQLYFKTANYLKAESSYSQVLRDTTSATSVRWEAQAGLAEVHAAQGKNGAAEQEFDAAIATIANAQRQLQREEFRLSFLSSAIRFYNAYVDFLVAQHRPDDALAIAERSRAQTLTAGLTEPSQALAIAFPRIHPRELAARFNSVILFYSLGTPHSHLWIITPEKTTLLSLPAQAEIDSLVKSYRDQVLDGDDPLEAAKSPGTGLYSMLVQQAAKFIPAGARVIVLPDGNLNSLNFDTLIVPRPTPHYWIQDVTLTTANSLTLLERSQSSRPPENPRLFMVGDPLSSEEQFPPLRQAAREMSLVRNYFKEDRRRILNGKEATPAAYFSSEPERFDYLHFVTHGTASRTHPLDSAVILTKSGDSTKLYAHEIITRPLNAYLVTVSACDGVGKRTYAGEGLVGLSWAFLRAGAHNVIASLWEVNDDSTPQLMDGLYKGLSAGQDPATALRNAKLTLVRSQGNFRKPFYWAPFQLYAGS
jgi:CHAT domain-containing protein/tetratricopeptide (TPR) repeat protein